MANQTFIDLATGKSKPQIKKTSIKKYEPAQAIVVANKLAQGKKIHIDKNGKVSTRK